MGDDEIMQGVERIIVYSERYLWKVCGRFYRVRLITDRFNPKLLLIIADNMPRPDPHRFLLQSLWAGGLLREG
jgi:hypothetical protein